MLTSKKRLDKAYKTAKVIEFDNRSKFILFSDCHRGDNSFADDFANNRNIYYHALKHYYNNGFIYCEVGDGDELWENLFFKSIFEAHKNVYLLMKQFYTENRLHLIWGNHDMVLKNKNKSEAILTNYFDKVSGTYKELLPNLKFNESIKQYGWEDNLFALQLAQKGVKIAHINNPLLHTGIESNEVYLAKTIIACKTLASLVLSEQYKLELQSIKLYRAYQNLAKLNLIGLFCFCFKIIKTGIENHLCAKQPNLIYFDLWKLYQLAMALNSSHTSVNRQ